MPPKTRGPQGEAAAEAQEAPATPGAPSPAQASEADVDSPPEEAEPEQPAAAAVVQGEPRQDEPPAELAELAIPRLARAHAEVTLEVRGGLLTFYQQGFFHSPCRQPNHGRCVMTRTALEGRAQGQGRPLGLLCAWLEHGIGLPDKASHWSKKCWPDLAERQHHRALLPEMRGGDALLA